jgi:hypothetical protein
MNSIDLNDSLEALPIAAIALSPEQIDQAMRWSRSIPNSTQQWQTYLNALALSGFEQWLTQRARDISLDAEQASIWQSQDTVFLPGICQIRANGFKICLMATESQPDEVAIPRAAIAPPDLASHFYVAIAIYEELAQIAVHSFLRYDQLIAQIPSLQPDAEDLYWIPITAFEPDLDRLLLYLRCSEPTAFSVPGAQHSALSTQHSALSELPSPIPHPPSPISIRRWFQNELDELAQQLSWILLPPVALENALRLTARAVDRPTPTEGFEGVIKQLMRNGMTLPPNSRMAYHDLTIGTVTVRLYAIAGTLTPANQPPEWTLLVILGSPSQNPLPLGIQLQVSEANTVLTQQTLTPPNAYLFAKVTGTLDEQFSVTVTLPTGETHTLPTFCY